MKVFFFFYIIIIILNYTILGEFKSDLMDGFGKYFDYRRDFIY